MDPIAQTLCPYPLAFSALRGDSIDVRVRLVSAATGRPIALTGYSGTASIYNSANASVSMHTMDVDVDQSPAGGATTGIVTITLDGSDSTTWLEAGAWALTLTNGPIRKTIIAGPWILRPLSMIPSGFVCGIGPVGGACGDTVALVGGDCGVTANGYTTLLLPYPPGSCAC